MVRVLIIDDNADFRGVLAHLVNRGSGLEVVAQAGSIAEARQKLEGVDVALVDRGLPDGDGLELLGELREAGTRTFVISSTREVTHPSDALQAGADGVIDKLAPPETLFATIRSSVA